MKFDPTVNTGQIVQLFGIVALSFAAWSNVKSDLAVQKVEIQQAQSQAAQQGQKIDAIATDVRNVERLVYDVKSELSRLQGRAMAPVVTPAAVPAVPVR